MDTLLIFAETKFDQIKWDKWIKIEIRVNNLWAKIKIIIKHIKRNLIIALPILFIKLMEFPNRQITQSPINPKNNKQPKKSKPGRVYRNNPYPVRSYLASNIVKRSQKHLDSKTSM